MLLTVIKSDGPPVTKAFLFVVGFAVIGICVLAVALATGAFISAEPENGVLSGGAMSVSDAGASGGKAVQFGSASGTQTCTSPVFSSSDPQGKWPSSGNPYVNNNVWNTAEAGPQTIYVCGLGSFYIISDQPDLANDRGSVKSYPGVCRCDFNKPIGQFTNITGTFAESMPHMGEWNATYDIFMGSGQEIMIDNETYNHPPQDGSPVTIDGIAYHALKVDSGFIVLGMDNFEKSGTINLLHVFQWLEGQGWVKSSDPLNMVGYGVEISYTESSPGVPGPERFDVTGWSLTAN